MANSKSAEKRIRQTARRTARNKALQSRVKTYRKQTLAAAAEGNKDGAQESFKKFASAVDKCAKKRFSTRTRLLTSKAKQPRLLKRLSFGNPTAIFLQEISFSRMRHRFGCHFFVLLP